MKRLLCICILIATALFLFVSFASADSYIVTGDFVNLRTSPEISASNIITNLFYGDSIHIINSHNDWYLVSTSNQVGYIHSDYVGIENTGTSAITNASVNFRKGPDVSYKVIVALSPNTAVKVLDTSSNWYKVEYNKTTGYVYSKYLDLTPIENETLIGVYTTKFSTGTSQSGRVKNIQKGANLIDEYTIAPTETFSLLSAIGPITKSGGYHQAPEYMRTPDGTKTVTGYGGGVCQLATTLYQSVCNAQDSGSRLLITEHHHHSKSVYYVKDGEDATISWNSGQDFAFQNNNSYSIRIRTFVKNGVISCMIYKIY